MFDNLEALIALEQYGSISRAAARLGLTQSAVSKRIKSLSDELNYELIEPSGRGVVLTPYAAQLLERVRAPYRDLREAFSEELAESTGELLVALSGALFLGWGAKVLKRVRKENPNIRFSFSSHRSPIAIARVRSGECMCAIVHGSSELTPDLSAKFIVDESVVIVPSSEKPYRFPRKGTLKLLTVEAHSETWSVMDRKLRRGATRWGLELEVENSMQNFMSVTQLARAGFGHGLTPIGVPLSLGVPRSKLVQFPKPGIKIPVSLVGRRSVLDKAIVQQFYESLQRHAPAEIA